MSMSMNEFIQVSHNDMDGAGCNIVLREKFPDIKTYHTNYNDITQHLEYVDTDITFHTKLVFVTDLSFSKEDLIMLVRLAQRHEHVTFVYIDHHDYEGERGEVFAKIAKVSNIKVLHEIGTSATKLTYRFTKSTNPDLGKLVDIIDVFDIWRLHDPLFQAGFFLNTIFWEFKMSGFKYQLIANDFKIPKSFKNQYVQTLKEKDEYIKALEAKNLIMKNDEQGVFIAFCDRFKSFFQMDFPEYWIHILPYESKNNISVRINSDINAGDATELKDMMIAYAMGFADTISAGGHAHAFGITVDPSASENSRIMMVQGLAQIAEQFQSDGYKIIKQSAPNLGGIPTIDIDEDEIPF